MRDHGDKEPSLSELLDDPLVCLLMTRDGVARSDLEALMAEMQNRALGSERRPADFTRSP